MIYRANLEDYKEAVLLGGPGHGRVVRVAEETVLPPTYVVLMNSNKSVTGYDPTPMYEPTPIRTAAYKHNYYLNRISIIGKSTRETLQIPIYEYVSPIVEFTGDEFQDTFYHRVLDTLSHINDKPGAFILLSPVDFAYFRLNYMQGMLTSEESEHRVKFGRTDILEVQTMNPGDMYVSP